MNPTIDEIVRILKDQNTKFAASAILLSLRTKDAVTSAASNRLFSLAKTPEEMLQLSTTDIENTIYPVGFYRRKAVQIREISKKLTEENDSKVPDEIDDLLKIKGVGRKTAKTPDQTEFELRRILPEEYWRDFNDLLVVHGQNVCTPISPRCSECPISRHCGRVGVVRSR
jgi:endonuclease-3